jgi:hypothetical protein
VAPVLALAVRPGSLGAPAGAAPGAVVGVTDRQGLNPQAKYTYQKLQTALRQLRLESVRLEKDVRAARFALAGLASTLDQFGVALDAVTDAEVT